jgi:hypothetical protein
MRVKLLIWVPLILALSAVNLKAADQLTAVEMKAHLEVLSAPLNRLSSRELYGSITNGVSTLGFKDKYLSDRGGLCRTENYNGFMKSSDGRMLLAACKRAKSFLKMQTSSKFQRFGDGSYSQISFREGFE